VHRSPAYPPRSGSPDIPEAARAEVPRLADILNALPRPGGDFSGIAGWRIRECQNLNAQHRRAGKAGS